MRVKYGLAGFNGRWGRRGIFVLLGVLVLCGIWVIATAVLAARAAERMELDLAEARVLVTSGQPELATAIAQDVTAQAGRAHEFTSGPIWWLGASIPYVGEPLKVVRNAAEAGNRVGAISVPALVQLAGDISPAKLRVNGDSVNLAPLIAAAPELHQAARALDAANAAVAKLPHSTWLPFVDSRRNKLQQQLQSIDGYVGAADRAAQILPAMAGWSTMQRYFVGLQNEAEMRGTGGIPGAFAIMEVFHGKVTFTHFESDQVLLPVATGQLVPTGLNFGSDYDSAWGRSEPTSLYVNSNLSPNFPYAAQIWAKMWQQVSGEHVDGAIALDPAALSYFLAVTGPAVLPDGTAVSAQNVVSLTERDEYALYPNLDQRKDFLVDLIHATDDKITSGSGDTAGLVHAASAAASQHRLLVWSADPAVEAVLAQSSYAGAIPATTQPFSGLVINNIAAGKLDYYLARSVQYQRTGCGPTRDVQVTITLTDDAPAGGLPAYVDTRLDTHSYPVQPGDDRVLVDYLATDGAQLMSVTLDGAPATLAVQTEAGHTDFRYDLELPRGKTQTLVLNLQEPAGTDPPVVWQQPGVNPLRQQYYSQSCG